MKRKRQKITNRSFSSYAFQAVLAIQGHTCEVDSNFTEMDLGNCFPSKYFMIYLQDILVDRCNIRTLYLLFKKQKSYRQDSEFKQSPAQ